MIIVNAVTAGIVVTAGIAVNVIISGRSGTAIAFVEIVQLGFLGCNQRVIEAVVLLAGHRAVDVRRLALVVARREEGFCHVYRLEADYRRGGVVEVEVIGADEAGDIA